MIKMKKYIPDFWKSWASNNGKAFIATVITHMNSISVGICQGYSAVLLPQLVESHQDDELSSFHIDAEVGSWIAGLGVLLTPFGALLSGMLMDIFGRKMTLLMTTIPFFIGWGIIAISHNLFTLNIGRCICGIATGMTSSCYVYVAEISAVSTRGLLLSFGPIFVSLGVVIVYILGYILHWKLVAAFGAFISVLSFLAILIIPETPSWLAAQGYEEDASKSLHWFHNNSKSVNDNELKCIMESAKACKKLNSVKEAFLCFCKPQVYKPFFILILFFILQELSGIYMVLFYAIDFFTKAGSSIDHYLASITVSLFRFFISIIGCLCIQRFRRKVMTCTSASLMFITMFIATCYEYSYTSINDVSQRPCKWIPLVCILANVSSSMLGMLQLPWSMIGELFPFSIRGSVGGIVSSLAYLFIFLTVKFYPLLVHTINLSGTMFLFTISSAFAVFYAIFLLPETKGKTLLQIENSFITQKNEKELPTVSLKVEISKI